MNKLLRANLARLVRNKAFWLLTALMALDGGAYTALRNARVPDEVVPLDRSLATFFIPAALFLAIFTALYIGTEYSDGAIRNKLMVGHGRGKVYCANLIVCLLAGLAFCAAYLLPYLAVGIPLLGEPTRPTAELATSLACGLGAILAFGALMVMVSMLCSSRAVSSVLCIMLLLALLTTGLSIQANLEEPERITAYEVSVEGGMTWKDEPNPRYVGGTERKVLEHLNDALPGGQLYQLEEGTPAHPLRMGIWDGVVMLLSTLGGILVFRRKDLK